MAATHLYSNRHPRMKLKKDKYHLFNCLGVPIKRQRTYLTEIMPRTALLFCFSIIALPNNAMLNSRKYDHIIWVLNDIDLVTQSCTSFFIFINKDDLLASLYYDDVNFPAHSLLGTILF